MFALPGPISCVTKLVACSKSKALFWKMLSGEAVDATVIESVQSQDGQGFEQPDQVKCFFYGRGLALADFERSLLTSATI